jgi:hypothetical protein
MYHKASLHELRFKQQKSLHVSTGQCSPGLPILRVYESCLKTFVRTPSAGNRLTARRLLKEGNTSTEKRGHISVSRGGFEITSPVFEQQDTEYASNIAIALMGTTKDGNVQNVKRFMDYTKNTVKWKQVN